MKMTKWPKGNKQRAMKEFYHYNADCCGECQEMEEAFWHIQWSSHSFDTGILFSEYETSPRGFTLLIQFPANAAWKITDDNPRFWALDAYVEESSGAPASKSHPLLYIINNSVNIHDKGLWNRNKTWGAKKPAGLEFGGCLRLVRKYWHRLEDFKIQFWV